MERDKFKSRTGFIIACIGSAVGMGNIWLFPTRLSALGGAAFLIPYFICVIVIGFTGVVEEMTFGRAMGAGRYRELSARLRKEQERAGGSERLSRLSPL